MDVVLHTERLEGRAKRLHRRNIDDLPDKQRDTFRDTVIEFVQRGDPALAEAALEATESASPRR